MKMTLKEIHLLDDQTLKIKEKTLFKAGGEDGLHLWEAAIVLARYLLKNEELVSGKSIIELGSGCGLTGIATIKFAKPDSYTFTDNQEEVLNNISANLKFNSIKTTHKVRDFRLFKAEDAISVCKLDWRDYKQLGADKFDLILGSELVYQGGYLEELSHVIKNLLAPEGTAIIALPKERSMTETFLNFCEEREMVWKSKCANKLGGITDNVTKEESSVFEEVENMEVQLYFIKHA